MAYLVFSDAWADQWADEIRKSEAYRKASETWEGSISLEVAGDGDSTPAAVFVDLWRGECRAARAATPEDLEAADYALRASLETWQRVLDGALEPILGLMSGKLKLRKGSLAALTPYMQASKELVAAAARVDSTFPDAL
ncbi:MAG: SCP2 sterol-binding domain-containing protein [Acidobacteriota bacterium]